MKVLLLTHPRPAAPYGIALLEALPEVTALEYTPDLPPRELADVDALLARELPPALAGRLPKLRWACLVGDGQATPWLDGVPVACLADGDDADIAAGFIDGLRQLMRPAK